MNRFIIWVKGLCRTIITLVRDYYDPFRVHEEEVLVDKPGAVAKTDTVQAANEDNTSIIIKNHA